LTRITQDACAFFEDHGLYDDFGGVVYDVEEGKRVAAAVGEHKAAILQNHGLTSRPDRGRGGVVVHHHETLLPGAADRHGGRHA